MYIYEVLSILVSIIILTYASFEDVRKREISDSVWLVYLLFGLIFRAADIATVPTLGHFFDLIISITVPASLFIALFYFGFFGGADAKTFMCIALSNPKPSASLPIFDGYLLPFYSLSIFDNSVILSLSTILLNLSSNICWLISRKPLFDGLESEARWKKIVAFFTCRKARKEDVRSSPSYYSAERLVRAQDGTSKRQIKLIYRLDEDDTESLPDSEYILAHYTVPLIVFVTIGFLVSIFLGDIIMLLVSIITKPFV
ncbi:MAG: A24 family peptidase [Thermoproteota archaeon]